MDSFTAADTFGRESVVGDAASRFASRLNIALVAPPYFDIPPRAYGGVEAVVASLADALVERGHKVILIGAGVNGTKAEFLPVWHRAVPERLGEAFPEIAHTSLARAAVQDLHRTGGLDVVHDHTGGGPLNAPFFATLGLATVVTVHGPVTGDLGLLYRSLHDSIHLVAISHRQRQLAPGLPWIATVHNALSIQDWPYQKAKDNYALFLGRFHHDKGAHLALDAAHAAGIPVVLAGKCAEPVEKDYFEREIKPRLRSTDQFFGMADATQKRVLLARARCLLFPIQWEEPFGMVLIEAMACGTPVVALHRGAVPEIVIHGETGIICRHPDELPDAISHIHHINPAACRRRVILRFNADRLATGYERAYHGAIAHIRARQSQARPVGMLPAAAAPSIAPMRAQSWGDRPRPARVGTAGNAAARDPGTL